jgi:NADH-quinone oxidoreductase subunit M
MGYWLLILVFLPLLGAIVGAAMPRDRANLARNWALAISTLTALVAIWLAINWRYEQDLNELPATERLLGSVQYDFGGGDIPLPDITVPIDPEVRQKLFIPDIGFSFHLGMDAISLWLVLLTAILTPCAVAASFGSIKDRQKEYYAWMLLLLSAMLGVFVARDVLLFYIFFELTLIPMFFIIGIWGGPERRYAAAKFFLFTFAGSVFTLAGVVYLGLRAGTFDLTRLMVFAQGPQLTDPQRFWVLMAFLAGFAVKVPLFPVHTWLPLAHTEAPTAGSVILAGVLLKLGTYGLLRLALPLAMVSSAASGLVYPTTLKVLAILCIVGIIYGALVAWVQRDIKKLVAYSSVSHLGFCVLGMLALTAIGIQGSILYMINHGLSTGALFLVIGMIYDRYHTRDIDQLSGLARVMPKLAFFFVFFTLASIGLPGLNGFVSEFLSVLGAFTSPHLGIGYGAFAALGVILGAVYMLHMLARVLFGPLKEPAVHAGGEAHSQANQGQAASLDYAHPGTQVQHAEHDEKLSRDINAREVALLIPIALACLLLGVIPAYVTRTTAGPVDVLRNPLPVVVQIEQEQQIQHVAVIDGGMGSPPMRAEPAHGRGAHATYEDQE